VNGGWHGVKSERCGDARERRGDSILVPWGRPHAAGGRPAAPPEHPHAPGGGRCVRQERPRALRETDPDGWGIHPLRLGAAPARKNAVPSTRQIVPLPRKLKPPAGQSAAENAQTRAAESACYLPGPRVIPMPSAAIPEPRSRLPLHRDIKKARWIFSNHTLPFPSYLDTEGKKKAR
jgi:hypothetical protein